MLVIVSGMSGVAVPIMHVIGVVGVPNRLVSAGLSVAMLAVVSVFAVATALALIPVAVVLAVSMAVMQEISMPLVLDSGMAATCVVLVARMASVLPVFALIHALFLNLSSRAFAARRQALSRSGSSARAS